MLTFRKNTVGGQEIKIGGGGQCPPAGDAPGYTCYILCITPTRVTNLRGPTPCHCTQTTQLHSKSRSGRLDRPEI